MPDSIRGNVAYSLFHALVFLGAAILSSTPPGDERSDGVADDCSGVSQDDYLRNETLAVKPI